MFKYLINFKVNFFNNSIINFLYIYFFNFVKFNRFHSKNEMEFIKSKSFGFYSFYFKFLILNLNRFIFVFTTLFLIFTFFLWLTYLLGFTHLVIPHISLNHILIITVLSLYVCFICFLHRIFIFLIQLMYFFNLLCNTHNFHDFCLLFIMYTLRIFFKLFFSFHFMLLLFYPLCLDFLYYILSIVPLFKWIYLNIYINFLSSNNILTFSRLHVNSLSRFTFYPINFHLSSLVDQLQLYTLDSEISVLNKYRYKLWSFLKF